MNGRSKYFDRNDRKSLYGKLKKKIKYAKEKTLNFKNTDVKVATPNLLYNLQPNPIFSFRNFQANQCEISSNFCFQGCTQFQALQLF